MQSFQVSNYHLFVISSANNRNIASFTVKRSFNRLHNISKDGLSNNGRKMPRYARNTESGCNHLVSRNQRDLVGAF